jgi:hypothetical protein
MEEDRRVQYGSESWWEMDEMVIIKVQNDPEITGPQP